MCLQHEPKLAADARQISSGSHRKGWDATAVGTNFSRKLLQHWNSKALCPGPVCRVSFMCDWLKFQGYQDLSRPFRKPACWVLYGCESQVVQHRLRWFLTSLNHFWNPNRPGSKETGRWEDGSWSPSWGSICAGSIWFNGSERDELRYHVIFYVISYLCPVFSLPEIVSWAEPEPVIRVLKSSNPSARKRKIAESYCACLISLNRSWWK